MEARCFVFFFFFFGKILDYRWSFLDSFLFALLLEDVDIKEGWKIRDNMLQRKRYFLILDKKKMLRYLFEFNHSMTRNSIFSFFLPINRSDFVPQSCSGFLKRWTIYEKIRINGYLLARVAKANRYDFSDLVTCLCHEPLSSHWYFSFLFLPLL